MLRLPSILLLCLLSSSFFAQDLILQKRNGKQKSIPIERIFGLQLDTVYLEGKIIEWEQDSYGRYGSFTLACNDGGFFVDTIVTLSHDEIRKIFHESELEQTTVVQIYRIMDDWLSGVTSISNAAQFSIGVYLFLSQEFMSTALLMSMSHIAVLLILQGANTVSLKKKWSIIEVR